MNQPTNHLFTFTNSVKNSHKATPDASKYFCYDLVTYPFSLD